MSIKSIFPQFCISRPQIIKKEICKKALELFIIKKITPKDLKNTLQEGKVCY